MSISHTDAHPAVRLAGSCGIASGVLLLATPALPAPDRITHTLWLLGWLLLLGFFAGIATLTRGTGDRTAWLSPAISAAAAVLVSIHLINVGIEYTANHLSKASPAHEPLHEVGGALFTLGNAAARDGLGRLRSGRVGRAGAAALARLDRPPRGPDRARQRDHARIRGCMGIPHRHHLGVHRRHQFSPCAAPAQWRRPSWPPPPADATPAGAPPSCWTGSPPRARSAAGRSSTQWAAGSKSAGSQPADKSNPVAVKLG